MASKFVFMPSFERSIKSLQRRYRRVLDDIEVALEEVESTPDVGTVIPNDYSVRKLRVASRDMQRGKRGGYRLLYLLGSNDSDTDVIVYLLMLYAKSEQENVSIEELQRLVEVIRPD
jgi:mRNA-degrading endonuclease RelE of RelBE toxin-antitoxin system